MEVRPTILLVEDNHDHLRITRRILERSGVGATIEVARDGQEALDRLSAREGRRLPDLVLLDLNMPKVSGRDVLKVMRADPSLRTIPVVVVSSSNRHEDAALANELGASGFISKGAGIEHFTNELDNLQRLFFPPVTPDR